MKLDNDDVPVIANLFKEALDEDVLSVDLNRDMGGLYVVETEDGKRYFVGDLDVARNAANVEAAAIFEDAWYGEHLLRWFDDTDNHGLDERGVFDLLRDLYDPEYEMKELDDLEYIYQFEEETGLNLVDMMDYGLNADSIRPYINYYEVGEYLVDCDGIENFLASYDGREIYLGNDYFAYRFE